MRKVSPGLKRWISLPKRLMQLFTAIIVAAFPVAVGGGIVFGLRPALGGVLCCMGAAAGLCFAGAELPGVHTAVRAFRRRWRRAGSPDAPFTRVQFIPAMIVGLVTITFSIGFPVAMAGFLVWRAMRFFCDVTEGAAN